jgi:hypothetical protein
MKFQQQQQQGTGGAGWWVVESSALDFPLSLFLLREKRCGRAGSQQGG